jgi:ribonucleoside-triphosphate reductase
MGSVIEALPREVIKRNGHLAAFDLTKIRSAILRAGQASGEFGEAEADLLTTQSVKVLLHSARNTPPDIERIQDVVEQSLIASNHFQTARGYIAYRETHKRLREDRKTLVDVEASINEYSTWPDLLYGCVSGSLSRDKRAVHLSKRP